MPEYDNNLRGVLFKNDKKETANHPDYKGNCEVDGVAYWLSAWIKTDKNDRKYMSLSFTRKDNAVQPKDQANARQQSYAGPHQPVGDPDVPF